MKSVRPSGALTFSMEPVVSRMAASVLVVRCWACRFLCLAALEHSSSPWVLDKGPVSKKRGLQHSYMSWQ